MRCWSNLDLPILGLGFDSHLGPAVVTWASQFIPIAPVYLAVKYGPGFGWGGKKGENICPVDSEMTWWPQDLNHCINVLTHAHTNT